MSNILKEMKFEYPCILKFYFDGCGPCKKVSPLVDNLIEEFKKARGIKLHLYPIDTLNEDNKALVDEVYDVRSVPAFAVLTDHKTSTPLMNFRDFEKYIRDQMSER